MLRATLIILALSAGVALAQNSAPSAPGPTGPLPTPDPRAPTEVQWMAAQPRIAQMNNELMRQAHIIDEVRGQSAWWQDCAQKTSWCPAWAFSGQTK